MAEVEFGKWVPIEDGYPDNTELEYVPVLVTTHDGNSEHKPKVAMTYFSRGPKGNYPGWNEATYGPQEWADASFDPLDWDVVAWMPLPTAYEPNPSDYVAVEQIHTINSPIKLTEDQMAFVLKVSPSLRLTPAEYLQKVVTNCLNALRFNLFVKSHERLPYQRSE